MSITDNLVAFTLAATLLTLTPGLDTGIVAIRSVAMWTVTPLP